MSWFSRIFSRQPKGTDHPVESKRVKTPTVLQMEAVECGAASLSIILSYHGKLLPLEELRMACNVTRDGVSALNIVRAARDYGLKAKGFKRSPETLKEMSFPVIIHWNMSHFLVVEGFGKGKFYLSDPAGGRYSVPEQDFDDAFTGVVLTFEPGPDFEPSKERPGLWTGLWPRLAHSKRTLLYVLIASMALVIPGLVIPTFTRVFIDQVLVQGLQDWLAPLILIMALMLCFNAFLTWLQQTYLLRLEMKLALSMSSSFLWHLLQLPSRFFQQRFGGDLASRVIINDKIAQLLSGQLATAALNAVSVVFYAALMFYYDVLLTVISIALVTLNGVALQLIARKRKDASFRLNREQGLMSGTIVQGIRSIETIKASGGENDFFQRSAGYFAKMLNAEQEFKFLSQTLSVVPVMLTALNTVAVLTIGSLRVIDGGMTLGMLVAYKYLMDSFATPVNTLVNLWGLVQTAEADFSRVDDVTRYERDLNLTHAPDETLSQLNGSAKLSGELVIRDLSFGYSKLDRPLIEGFDLHLQPGQRIALVGGSGSGKSTMAKLICGLYQPWTGEILFDDHPREDWPRTLITNSLALVDQEIMLFEGTIHDNLTLWDKTIPESTVIRAAKDAYIHEEIAARQGGYQSSIAEGGRNFSGGQRQRLELARALAQNPSLLVLDEATSALDALVEKEIIDHIRRRGCACVIVAHRLSTVRDCDEIIVLGHGKVLQRGTHSELLREGGHYANLIQAH